MSSYGYTDRLAGLDVEYKAAKPAGTYELPPDGEYQVVVDRFDVFESGKTGKLYLRIEMAVATGELAGWPVSILHGLEEPDRFGYLKKDLSTIGVEITKLSELEAALPEGLDVPLLIAVKTKGEHRNVYINQRLGDPIRTAPPAEYMPSTDVPFKARFPEGRPVTSWSQF